MHWADRFTQKMVDLYITNSKAARSHLLDHGLDDHRVAVAPSALPGSWYEEQATTPSPKFVMVGNSRPEKNQINGVRAFLAANLPTTLTVFTDDATEVNSYLAQVADSKRDKVFAVEGHQMEPKDYDKYGVLLHPSLSESLPLTIMEAQSRGCFVVASDTGDTSRLITEDSGLLIDPVAQTDIQEKTRQAYEKAANKRVHSGAPRQTLSSYVTQLIGLVNQVRASFWDRRL